MVRSGLTAPALTAWAIFYIHTRPPTQYSAGHGEQHGREHPGRWRLPRLSLVFPLGLILLVFAFFLGCRDLVGGGG